MSLLKKAWGVLSALAYFTFFGILYTFLRPLRAQSNETLRKKGRELNKQAAKNLKCDANSVFVKLPKGLTLHVVEAGDRNAKLVVLLHGFPDCWHSWHGVIPELVKKGYFVVAPDMRGYNLSDKPKNVKDFYMPELVSDVKELIESYNKKSAIVVAHDWGGIVAWELAARHPEVLEKLIILNAPHTKAYEREAKRNVAQLLSSWYILFFQIPFLAQNVITYNPHNAVKTFFKTINPNALSNDDKEVLACSYAQEGSVSSMINYYKGLVRNTLTKLLKKRSGPKKTDGDRRPGKIQVPTLVLWGQNDVALQPGCAMCSEWVEKVQVTYIPKCSHWVPYEVPEIVSREILKFIK